MKIGTKSILYGAHCFFLHPWFVALAWWKLYGFPWDIRLWVAFFVHDLGYWGKPNMDGEEGENHPYLGAKIMHFLFDKYDRVFNRWSDGEIGFRKIRRQEWYHFTLFHSRFLARREGGQYSRLCVADKLSFILTPRWIYLPMVKATGEIYEYIRHANEGKYLSETRSTATLNDWHDSVCEYMYRWVQEHKDLREDTWTPTSRKEAQS
ncbi:MAG: hypothetical protein ABJG41_01500 [Cyclobacteriaceae bacterium]